MQNNRNCRFPFPPPMQPPMPPQRPPYFRPPFAPPGRPPYGPGPARPYYNDMRAQSTWDCDYYVEEIDGRDRIRQQYEYMKEYYPLQVRWIQYFVEDALDKVDVEYSFIYDSYPDRNRIYQMTEDIYQNIIEAMDDKNSTAWKEEQDAELYWGYEDYMCLKDMIQILLLNEIFYRRVR